MADTSQNTERQWRFPLAIGLAVGVGMAVSRGVEANLEPSLGYWGAFIISLVATAVVGALVALAVYGLTKPGGKK